MTNPAGGTHEPRAALEAELDGLVVDDLRARGGVKWSRYAPDVVGAAPAEMDFGTSPAVRDALHAAVDAGALGYLPPPLSAAMGQAGATWLRSAYGWEVPPDQVHPLPDVLRGLEFAVERCLPAGAPVVLPTPAYMPFLLVPALLGRELVQVPMVADDAGRAVLDLDGIGRALAPAGGLVVLCNPQNPTGTVHHRAELEALAEVVEAHRGRVFADEIHAPLVYAPGRHIPYASVSPAASGHTVTATSVSKAWNVPGLKCAQLILTGEADRAVWHRAGALYSSGTSTLGAVGTIAAYQHGGPWLDGILGYLDGNRRLLADLVADHLPGVRYRPPEGTYLGWLDCTALGLDRSPVEVFLERGRVSLVDGAACGAPGWVRLNFATSRPILEAIVERMASALRA